MYIIGCVFMAVFGFVYFAMLDTKVPALIFIAIAVSGLPMMTLYGPEAALIAESFSPRLRYSGASLGYQLASIIAGGPSPFIATALFAAFHSSLPIALYILACADHRHHRDFAADGLHRQGHLSRISWGLTKRPGAAGQPLRGPPGLKYPGLSPAVTRASMVVLAQGSGPLVNC